MIICIQRIPSNILVPIVLTAQIIVASHVDSLGKDQHEIVGVVVWHKQLCNGLNLRKTIYIYILYIGLILLMLKKAGFRFEKVPIYLYLTK